MLEIWLEPAFCQAGGVVRNKIGRETGRTRVARPDSGCGDAQAADCTRHQVRDSNRRNGRL